MDHQQKYAEINRIAFDDGPDDFPEISNYDYATTFLTEIDYEAQLRAIRIFIERNRGAGHKLSLDIVKIEHDAQNLVGASHERAIDDRIDCLYFSVYQDAAHSMAAVGMLAPFIESLFKHGFIGVRNYLKQLKPEMETTPNNHERWQKSVDDAWDCRYVWEKGERQEGLVDGVLQLARATGLATYLPKDLNPTLRALFEYRNKMFHCGFEWPISDRMKFEKRIKDARWPDDWFSKAVSNKEPWAFYITDSFIDHCLGTADKIIEAFGTFARITIAIWIKD